MWPGTPIVLGLDVIEHTGGGDKLELLPQVVWTDPGRLAVGEETSLSDAFRVGAERLTGWPILTTPTTGVPKRDCLLERVPLMG